MGLLDNHTPRQHYQNNHPNRNNSSHGNTGTYNHYQFISLDNIINQFIIGYVGEGKLISKVDRMQVIFHAQRALAELSFDTFKSIKSLESHVTNSLVLPLPIDYVNYTKISCVDGAGIKKPLYPTLSRSSNPQKYQTDDDYEYLFTKNTFEDIDKINNGFTIENFDGNFIPSGELTRNGSFHGGNAHWSLNTTSSSTGQLNLPNSPSQPVVTATGTNILGDPHQGWFFKKNKIIGLNLIQNQGFIQENVNILSGESYKVSITISGYTSGTYRLSIVDDRGDITHLTDITANGTYTETLVAGGTTGSFSGKIIMLKQVLAGTGTTGYGVTVDNISVVRVGDEETSTTWSNYKSNKPNENKQHDYDYDDHIFEANVGRRYGIDPQHAQDNGSYYIDDLRGLINFSSNISGKTVIIDYISDSLGTDQEMQVHKLAEEAMYKSIFYAILSMSSNTPEYAVRRYKKEKSAAIRKAKLRLSNIKLEEITQILRGKSKQIKH